ncbi:MAG: hypothetical protein ABT940_07310 [Alphaproteobacteria bacterium]
MVEKSVILANIELGIKASGMKKAALAGLLNIDKATLGRVLSGETAADQGRLESMLIHVAGRLRIDAAQFHEVNPLDFGRSIGLSDFDIYTTLGKLDKVTLIHGTMVGQKETSKFARERCGDYDLYTKPFGGNDRDFIYRVPCRFEAHGPVGSKSISFYCKGWGTSYRCSVLVLPNGRVSVIGEDQSETEVFYLYAAGTVINKTFYMKGMLSGTAVDFPNEPMSGPAYLCPSEEGSNYDAASSQEFERGTAVYNEVVKFFTFRGRPVENTGMDLFVK